MMDESHYDANCDLVIDMEEMGIGVEEILQFAKGVLTHDEIRALLHGLEQMVKTPVAVD